MPINAEVFKVSGITPLEAVPQPERYYGGRLTPELFIDMPETAVADTVTVRLAPYGNELMTYAEARAATDFEDWFRTLNGVTDAILHRDGRKRAPIHNLECSREPSRVGQSSSWNVPATIALEGIAKFPAFDNYRVGIKIGAALLHNPSGPNQVTRRKNLHDPLNRALLYELQGKATS